MAARSDMDDKILDEAIAWHHALESDDADWDAYADWIEADPRHRLAFDQIALVDRAIVLNRDALRAALSVSDQPVETPRFRRRFALGTIAASIAAAVALPIFWTPWASTTYESEAGQRRNVSLANGAVVELAPSSMMIVSGSDDSNIDLASGEAYFNVRHDPRRMLTIKAGIYRITDIGTKFSVNVSPAAVRLGVAEGYVSVTHTHSDAPLRISAGNQFVGGRSKASGQISRIDASEVASWRQGRLFYTDVPLSLVASDMERYSGTTVIVDPSLENTHFSGVLVIGDGSKLLSDLADIMGIRTEMGDGSVRLSTDPSR